MVDLAIGLGIPILEMVLRMFYDKARETYLTKCPEYITQGHRFDIYEDIGCYPFTYGTWAAVFIVSLAPIAIGLVSAVYCSK